MNQILKFTVVAAVAVVLGLGCAKEPETPAVVAVPATAAEIQPAQADAIATALEKEIAAELAAEEKQ